MKKKGMTTEQIIRFFGLLLAIFLAVGGFLYWQGYMQTIGLVMIGVVVLVAGISFTFGIRVAQKDGFLDGYNQAENDFNNKKKG